MNEDANFFQQMQSAIAAGDVETTFEATYGFAKLMSCFRCAMMQVETYFKILNEEYSLRFDRYPICSITTRLKSPTGIYEKLRRMGYPATVKSIEENVYDTAGVRVICSFVDDVYNVADAFLRQDNITLISRNDSISQPRESGYRSLHLIVAVPIILQNEKRSMKVEIQLRTIAMDCWANMDHQLRYKKPQAFTEDMMTELHRCAELCAELDTRMDALRSKAEINSIDDKVLLKDSLDSLRQ